jgi:hypothetical protein
MKLGLRGLARFGVMSVLAAAAPGCVDENSARPTESSGSNPRRDGGVDSAPRDLAARELAGYERPPAPAAGTGHPFGFRDIGTTDKGELRVGTSVLTVRAGGAGLDGAADGFGFASVPMHGDGELVARVRSLQMADPRSTAGIMLRAGGEPGAASIFVGILGEVARGGRLVVRRTAGAMAEAAAPDVQIRAGQYLRIRRAGGQITVFRSSDRLAWVKVGAVEIDLPTDLEAGVAVSAGRAGAVTTAEIDQVRLLESDAAGWELEPMAGVGAKVSVAGGAVSLSANGDPFVTTAEPGTAVVVAKEGSVTITARVDSLGMAPKARVGLTFREGGPGRMSSLARHALIALDSAGKLTFQRRDRSTNFEAGAFRDGVKLPVWLRLARYDDPATFRTRIQGLYSTDGTTFTALDTVELALADPVMVGLLFTSGDTRVHGTAKLSNLSITPTATPIPPPTSPAGVDAAAPARPDAGAGS